MNRRNVLKNAALFFGYAVSATALTETFISCSNDKKLDWQPVFLTTHEANLIAEITERILPRTKTPGAKDLHIDKFVDKMLKDLLSKEEQADFRNGLEAFDKACEQQYGKSFVDCTKPQQEELLRKFDKEAAKLPPSVWGISLAPPSPTPFFRRLKALTLLGFYTSQQIGEKVLSFDPLPGGYIACMPLSQVGNAWNE